MPLTLSAPLEPSFIFGRRLAGVGGLSELSLAYKLREIISCPCLEKMKLTLASAFDSKCFFIQLPLTLMVKENGESSQLRQLYALR